MNTTENRVTDILIELANYVTGRVLEDYNIVKSGDVAEGSIASPSIDP